MGRRGFPSRKGERDELGRKLCNVCQGWKPEDEFWSDSSRPDGLTHRCKTCHSRRKDRYQAITPERINALLIEQNGPLRYLRRLDN